ncbi:MAG: hypothetical protein P4L59_12470 [Desulfosporosinus sp.]|nr:hypothetical protein [Desulfosporosinus sp.]
MNRNRIYRIHQAFDETYNKLKNDPELPEEGFAASLAFHHAPEKLSVFKDFRGYGAWYSTLYDYGIKVREVLKKIYDKAEKLGSSWHNGKKSLKELLESLRDLEQDIGNFRSDVSECQLCYIAGDIFGKHGYVNTLSDLIWEIDEIKSKIHTTVNRKLTEISTTRMTIVSLGISTLALVFSLLSFYISPK